MIQKAEINFRNHWRELHQEERKVLIKQFHLTGFSKEYKEKVCLILLQPYFGLLGMPLAEAGYKIRTWRKKALNRTSDLFFQIYTELTNQTDWPEDRNHILNKMINPFMHTDLIESYDPLLGEFPVEMRSEVLR